MSALAATPRTPLLGRLTAPQRRTLRADCRRLAELDDTEFGVRLLAGTPTHETRETALLARWAATAEEFGVALAARPEAGRAEYAGRTEYAEHAGRAEYAGPAEHAEASVTEARPPRVVEADGGLDPANPLLARYTSRPPTVVLYTDTLACAEELADELGWRGWYPSGSVREAALAHETAHCRLQHRAEKASLRRRLDHTVLRLGRYRFAGHVAGADELAAHAYARAVCGLGRSPLLLTAALARTLEIADVPESARER